MAAVNLIHIKLHERYARHRVHGEWFVAEPVLTDTDLLTNEEIASWAPPDPTDKAGIEA